MAEQSPPRDAAEARERLGQAQAALARQVVATERAFSHNVMLAQDRLNFVKREHAATMARLEEVRPLIGHPDGAFVYQQASLLATVYASIQKMMEIDLSCQAFNLDLVEKLDLLENEDFRDPDKYLQYKEAKLKLDLSLAYYYWMTNADAIDTVSRAALNVRIIEVRTSEEEGDRARRATELREAFKTDRDMGMLTGMIAQGFAEALELMEWGLERLGELDTRNAQVKRELLTDIKWAKLNGKIQTVMGETPQRVKGHPLLEKLFPASGGHALPFALASGEPQTGAPVARTPLPGQAGLRPGQPARPASATPVRPGAPGAPLRPQPPRPGTDTLTVTARPPAPSRPVGTGPMPPRPGALPGGRPATDTLHPLAGPAKPGLPRPPLPPPPKGDDPQPPRPRP